MEESIEKIWKEGFVNKKVSTVLKIEDIKSLQSLYLVDQFKKSYQTNIIVLTATAILILLAAVVGGVPFVGLFLFMLFVSLAILGKKELDKLALINMGADCYEFLRTFDNWLKKLLSRFQLIYRFWIPLFFLGGSWGILNTNFFIPFLGETIMDKILNHPNTYQLVGLPIIWMIGIGLAAIGLSFFSDHFFRREIRSIYGDTILRLDQLLAEMEELR